MSIKVTVAIELKEEKAETDEKTSTPDSFKDDVIAACKRFGADMVRMAAREQMEGYRRSLARVGLKSEYNCNQLQYISTFAFHQMTDKQKHAEYCRDNNQEPWLPL